MISFICFSSKLYYPKFLVLYKSIKKYHPESPIYLFGLNDLDQHPSDVHFEMLSGTKDLRSADPRDRPQQILNLFNKGAEKVVHMGSDCELFAPLTHLDELLDSNDIVLTPHILSPLPNDGKIPSNESIHLTGLLNADFIAIKNTSNSVKALKWYDEILAQKCLDDRLAGIFYDQTWLNFFPQFFDKVHILRNMNYNTAYWNIHLYNFKWDGQAYRTDDGPLVFFHYSGFNEECVEQMSKYQNRHIASGDILKIYSEYKTKLDNNRLEIK